jgi:hypothetical protein
MMALLWKEKRVVLMLSTCHNVDTQREERVVRRGVSEEVVKQKAVCDYTVYIEAVNKADHYITSYSFTRNHYSSGW